MTCEALDLNLVCGIFLHVLRHNGIIKTNIDFLGF